MHGRLLYCAHALKCHSPEFSSFTREDMVLVIESAATSKSFLKFRLAPETEESHNIVLKFFLRHKLGVQCSFNLIRGF